MSALNAQLGDVVKIGTHRYLVTEIDAPSATVYGSVGYLGAQRIRHTTGFPVTYNGRRHMVDEAYRSFDIREVESVNRGGKIIYRRPGRV
jgi:hypothetical protein